ncbi:hypothetical protein [uncultured Porphyromonas sp.]|uniref:hypothetical protein n=1 Tax=uncultured Porphyromonas sp. TaxID=159274 RepID=UPI002629D999|nr:hypothetical protein [uncultured Porphyromonas sp.]
MLLISLCLCSLSALYPCYRAWERMKRSFSEPALALFMAMALYALFFLYGTVLRVFGGSAVDAAYSGMVAKTGIGFDLFILLLTGVTVALIPVNLLMGWIIRRYRRSGVIILGGIILLLAILSIPVSMMIGDLGQIAPEMASFGSSLVGCFFLECCGVMAYFAWLLGLTYQEFCVIGNIYMQGAICLLAALAPLLLCIRTKQAPWKWLLSGGNALLHFVVISLFFSHYWMPLERAFDLCVQDLNRIGALFGSSYVMVNIIIFVILFVVDLALNALLYLLLAGKLTTRQTSKISL